jgi:hypothetical protein
VAIIMGYITDSQTLEYFTIFAINNGHYYGPFHYFH